MNLISNLNIILVDDNEMDLFFHERLLKHQGLGHHIFSFNNAQQALDHLTALLSTNSIPPIAILLDILMPEMDGFEFLKHFEAFPEKIRSQVNIVMVSSTLNLGDISRTEAHPLVHTLLKKPLNVKELKETFGKLYNIAVS